MFQYCAVCLYCVFLQQQKKKKKKKDILHHVNSIVHVKRLVGMATRGHRFIFAS